MSRVTLVVGYVVSVGGFAVLVRRRPRQSTAGVVAAALGTLLVALGWWWYGRELAAGVNAGFAGGFLTAWWLRARYCRIGGEGAPR